MPASEPLNIRQISPRVSVAYKPNAKEEEVKWSLVIIPYTDKWRLWGLFIWILSWTISGLIIIGSYKFSTSESQKLFILIFTFFWIYYEWKIIQVFMWRKWGKERLWIKEGTLYLEEQTMFSRRNIRHWKLKDLHEINLVEFNEKSFSDFLSNSFWNKGKPRICIHALGKNYFFGYQLSDKEAKEVLRELQNQVRAL